MLTRFIFVLVYLASSTLSFAAEPSAPLVFMLKKLIIADTDVKGGYSWTKNDYETVQQ
jgi:hypothetical protein